MNKKSVMLQGMSRELKLSYFCAGRVTVGEIGQVVEGCLVRRYVAKIRGIIIGNENDMYKFESPEKARLYGQSVLAAWRKELADL